MKPRICFSERTPPLPVKEFGAPPADSPALRLLISFGLVALSLWLCAQVLGQAWPTLFPSAALALEKERLSATHPAPAPRAVPVALKRALPVPGAHYPASLPDGQLVTTTWKGVVSSFSQLPASPALGDQYAVTEGPGVSWIWATPLGWNHPAWIDP